MLLLSPGILSRGALDTPSGWTPPLATLDPSNTGSHINLSGGNLIATSASSSPSTFYISRSTNGRFTGQVYFEATYTGVWPYGIGGSAFGIENASADLGTGSGDYPVFGTDNNGIGFFANDGKIYFNGAAVITTGISFALGNTAGVAVDFNAKLYWIRNNTAPTVWNAGSGAAPGGSGGASFSGINAGPYYAGVMLQNNIYTGVNQLTLNFGATAYNQSAPAGFVNY